MACKLNMRLHPHAVHSMHNECFIKPRRLKEVEVQHRHVIQKRGPSDTSVIDGLGQRVRLEHMPAYHCNCAGAEDPCWLHHKKRTERVAKAHAVPRWCVVLTEDASATVATSPCVDEPFAPPPTPLACMGTLTPSLQAGLTFQSVTM